MVWPQNSLTTAEIVFKVEPVALAPMSRDFSPFSPAPLFYERSIMDDKELTANLSMLAVQFSALNQIVMGLMMVLDPAVLESTRDTIQERLDTLEAGTLDQHATAYAIAQLSLVINGPAPKTRLRLVPGKDGG
jgi:hypothetical protein